MVVDGKHSKITFDSTTALTLYAECELEPGTEEKIGPLVRRDYHSYKLKTSCLCIQVCMELDGWTSDSLPAGKWNDQKQFTESGQLLIDELDHNDVLCFDGGYTPSPSIRSVIPHRKPNYEELTQEEERENSVISEFRGN